jgi:hypothetical protein
VGADAGWHVAAVHVGGRHGWLEVLTNKGLQLEARLSALALVGGHYFGGRGRGQRIYKGLVISIYPVQLHGLKQAWVELARRGQRRRNDPHLRLGVYV